MGSVKLAKDAHPHETLANLLQTHDTRSPLPPAPPDASSSCDWDCRHLPGNGKAAVGTGVALHPLASVSANSLDGTSWCFQERAWRSPRYGHSWRPASNRRWVPGGRCSRGSICGLWRIHAPLSDPNYRKIDNWCFLNKTTDVYSRV
ncbi:hypothetical protein PVAP13_1KG407600 [Panicum virgatum]|uniref:Uncharacterized protein n=1 Tax=Panicum virgatum TaxID=38727 RepID=A0A8T0XLT3_PANVG|nr:hypothetical protein PVAP13_1KG407600 [Panicum virgatum]